MDMSEIKTDARAQFDVPTECRNNISLTLSSHTQPEPVNNHGYIPDPSIPVDNPTTVGGYIPDSVMRVEHPTANVH